MSARLPELLRSTARRIAAAPVALLVTIVSVVALTGVVEPRPPSRTVTRADVIAPDAEEAVEISRARAAPGFAINGGELRLSLDGWVAVDGDEPVYGRGRPLYAVVELTGFFRPSDIPGTPVALEVRQADGSGPVLAQGEATLPESRRGFARVDISALPPGDYRLAAVAVVAGEEVDHDVPFSVRRRARWTAEPFILREHSHSDLAMPVPAGWRYDDASFLDSDDRSLGVGFVASPAPEIWNDRWDVVGVYIGVSAVLADRLRVQRADGTLEQRLDRASAWLARTDWSDDCRYDGFSVFVAAGGSFAGTLNRWVGCADSSATLLDAVAIGVEGMDDRLVTVQAITFDNHDEAAVTEMLLGLEVGR